MQQKFSTEIVKENTFYSFLSFSFLFSRNAQQLDFQGTQIPQVKLLFPGSFQLGLKVRHSDWSAALHLWKSSTETSAQTENMVSQWKWKHPSPISMLN